MISVTKLRQGVTFEYGGEPWRVSEYRHVHISRGGGTITVKARNLCTGIMRSLTFRSGDRVEAIEVERRALTFLYQEGEFLVMMDPVNFEQHRLPVRAVGERSRYLLEGQETAALLWDEELVDIDLPIMASLTVKEASPGVKGDTVAGASKGVILENGLHLRVPLFIKAGDRVVVDTRTGEYVERG